MKVAGSLDSNVLLRLILGDVPEQSSLAIKLIEENRLLAVSNASIIEVMFVLERHYKFERKQIAYAITEISRHPRLEVDAELIKDLVALFTTQPALSPEDCYLAIYAKQNDQLPLWTFDKKLAKRSGGLAREITA